MDIEEYKRVVQSRLKVSQLKKSIKKEIDEYEDQQLGIYEKSKAKYAPIIKSSTNIQNTIDQKQDELIKQLQQNQLVLTKINRDAMKELEDVSIEKGKLPILVEVDFDDEYWNKNDMFLQEDNLNMPSELYQKGVYLKKNDDKDFNNYLVWLQEKRDNLAHTNKINAKTHDKNIPIRKQYYLAIEQIIKALNATKIKTGSGVRKYKQPKRNAYKISQNKYNGLTINMPKLLNEMVLEVQKDGQIIYKDNADRSLINLLTKKFNSKKRYSQKAIEIFNNLNMLSNMPKHLSSKKSKLGSGNIYYTDPNELYKKLQLITGSRRAGNTNLRLKNEAYQLIDKLLELNVISKDQYDKYVQQHLV